MSRLFRQVQLTDSFHKRFSSPAPAPAPSSSSSASSSRRVSSSSLALESLPTENVLRNYFEAKCKKYNEQIANAHTFEELFRVQERLRKAQAYIESKADLYLIDYNVNDALIKQTSEKMRIVGGPSEVLDGVPTSCELPCITREAPILLTDEERRLFGFKF